MTHRLLLPWALLRYRYHIYHFRMVRSTIRMQTDILDIPLRSPMSIFSKSQRDLEKDEAGAEE